MHFDDLRAFIEQVDAIGELLFLIGRQERGLIDLAQVRFEWRLYGVPALFAWSVH